MGGNLQPAPGRKSGYRPVLLTLLFSFVLGGGSCAGFLANINANSTNTIAGLFFVVFALCAFAFVGSLIWLIVKAVNGSTNNPGGPR